MQRGGGSGRWSAAAAAVAAALAALVVALGAGAANEDGRALFDRLCVGCHTIGGGKLVGPDLQGVADRRDAEWVRRFLAAPGEVIPGTAMPDLGLTAAQVETLVAFLGYEGEETTPAPAPSSEPAPLPGDAERGKRLFEGEDRFEAGGPPCLSCHSVAGVGALGGGQLGPDLTGAFEKYGGEQGLRAALESVPFPTMAPIFSRKRLSAEERADLTAFLEAAAQEERPALAAGRLVGLSVGAAALIALVALGIWRRRLTGVRRPLVERARKE
ncbi:MAG TPA: c-type cytochrome [Gaiellaceae bacterium]|nr:c-type cytochrome [Gaiellaceae bacterium]